MGDVALPDGPAYFCSRGSVLGQVPGEVVAAAFGVFNPAVVVPAVTRGWTLTDAATIGEVRTEGATGQLRRILGTRPDGLDRATDLLRRANEGLRPEGRPLYAGLLALGLPGDPLGDMWRLGDRLREYRGDSHIASWTTAGFDATEIGLLTELYWGLPLRSYIRSRAWATRISMPPKSVSWPGACWPRAPSPPRAVPAVKRSRRRPTGPVHPIVANLADDLDELVGFLRTWSTAVQQAGGYPGRGPHDLAAVSRRPPTG